MISVVINTYNAERHLTKVLDSVKGFDEVLVCDMESTDSTLDIAKSYGCRILTFPRDKHTIVEPAREFAIRNASYEWVLVVDADEIISESLKKKLYEVTELEDAPDGLFLARRNYFMGRFMHAAYPDYILRFFRKEKTTWPPIIHVQPEVKGHVERLPRKNMDWAIEHLANDTISNRIRKTETYTNYEVAKKQERNYGLGSFLWRPFFRFFKAYVLKGGCRDGLPGFIFATLEGYYQFVMLSKLKEEQYNQK